MRTTLTLDDDVAARLESEARRTGLSFKETVNTMLRLGLKARRGQAVAKPFKVTPVNLGKPKVSIDNVEEALDALEGPWRR